MKHATPLLAKRKTEFEAVLLRISGKSSLAGALRYALSRWPSLTRYTTVAGVPVGQLIPAPRLQEIVQRARDGGAEIVRLLKTGSAFYAPAASTVEMVDAILMDRKRILPCAAYLQGEYGVDGLFVGVPVRLGAAGIEEVVQIELTPEEQAALNRSAGAVKELVDAMAALEAAVGG